MTSDATPPRSATRVVGTNIPDSWAWMRTDLLVRIAPFVGSFVVADAVLSRPAALGLSFGRPGVQLLFAAVAAPFLFSAAVLVQLWLTRRRGALSVPANGRDAWFQAGFYVINGPVEEAFFRGLVQGGVGVLWGSPIGFAVGTFLYSFYPRRGRWTWPDPFATALVGLPLGLAFWLLPGPPSLLGVSIAHVAATCGFLGPRPYH